VTGVPAPNPSRGVVYAPVRGDGGDEEDGGDEGDAGDRGDRGEILTG